MRVLLVAALVVLSSLAFSAPGHAQSGSEPLVKDAEGDTEVRAFLQDAPAKVPFNAADASTVDIVSFTLEETETALDFVLHLKSLKPTVGFNTYQMRFTWNDLPYVVGVRMTTLPSVGTSTHAYLATADDGWDWRAELEPQVDAAKGILRVSLEKAYVLDDEDEPPQKGDTLTDVYVTSSMSLIGTNGFFGEIADRAPDGEDAKTFTLQVGNFAAGSLRAWADQPVRVSNGGSTTFVYRVSLANTAEREHDVEAKPENLPQGWNVTVQSPLRIGATDEKTVAVLASVPFGHEHGGFDSFTLNFTSRSDPGSRASVRLGVLHTPIPQPAGHHADLFLHAEKPNGIRWGGWGAVTMNTDSGHEQDEPEAPAATSDGSGVIWWIPLNPRLAMGLDFDLDRAGALVGSVIGRTTGEATISAKVLYGPRDASPFDDDALTLLAKTDEQKIALDLSAPKAFSLVVTPTEKGDYVPFDPEANVFLKVSLDTDDGFGFLCCPKETTASLKTADFKLTLPLNEYHDRLTGLAEAAAIVDLVAEGAVEKLGRPGTVMTYAFTLKNRGNAPATFEVDLAGTDAAAGTLVPDEAITLEPQESRRLTLAVQIPPEAKEGEELEVLVFAHAVDDPGKRAIARTKTTVTLTGDANADETNVLVAARAESEKDTPGLGALGVVGAALLGLALRRAGRRG